MSIESKKRLGLALCGSYCTFEKLFAAAEKLSDKYELIPIMSENAAETDTRFGAASEHIKKLMLLSGKKVVTTIAEAEPLGPATPMDALLIARQHPGKAGQRHHRHLSHHGRQGPYAKRPAGDHRPVHQRRALRLGGKYRQAPQPQGRLLRALPPGRPGQEAPQPPGRFLPPGRDGAGRPQRLADTAHT